MIEFGQENKEINEKSRSAPFLLSIEDNEENILRILIAFPKEGEEGESMDAYPDAVKDILKNAKPICEDMDQVYEIIFDNYIIYQNRNESYTIWDDYEVRKGNYLIIFEKSRLLDYYEDVLFDFDDDETRKNKRKHYGIYTVSHILDIISNTKPKINKIKTET